MPYYIFDVIQDIDIELILNVVNKSRKMTNFMPNRLIQVRSGIMTWLLLLYGETFPDCRRMTKKLDIEI